MNPFIPFCVYVAARVFVQYLKSHPKDEQVKSSLQFLLNVMGHMKKKMPIVESFLVQLEVDLNGSLDDPANVRKFPYSQKKGAVSSWLPRHPLSLTNSNSRMNFPQTRKISVLGPYHISSILLPLGPIRN